MNLINEIPFDIPIKEIILQPGISQKAKNLCQSLGKRGLLVCDENTRDFVNLEMEQFVLPKSYKPTLETADRIAEFDADFFIAVGSGSLNDMVKYASAKKAKPYIVFATAASMNGYASANVSLIKDGFKKSYYAHCPTAIYMDTEIIAAAPKRLTNSGIGDSICRSTCEADATLSSQVCGTSTYSDLFTILRQNEELLFDNIEALCKALIFGGVAMYLAKSSAPASQSEHMLAHYMELMQPNSPQSFHGEQISVTTSVMCKIQEDILANPNAARSSFETNEDEIRKHFGKNYADVFIQQTRKKYSGVKISNLDLKQIEKTIRKSEWIISKLKSIGAPTQPHEIGWDIEKFNQSLKFAKYTRDRFTFLDLYS